METQQTITIQIQNIRSAGDYGSKPRKSLMRVYIRETSFLLLA